MRTTIELTAYWTAAAAYALATLAFFLWAAFRRPSAQRAGLGAAAAGLLPHALAIGLRWAEVGHGPFSSRYEVLSANAFLAVALFAGISFASRGIRALGVFVLPAALLAMGWASATFGLRYEVPVIFRSCWLYLHIGFAKTFFVFALLAGAAGLAWLLRRGSPGEHPWLPSRERLDLYGHQFLVLSFLCLGVMIVAGSIWAHQSWGRYWAWDPIETVSLVTWLAFGVILHFRVLHGWSGRRMAWLHLAALALALFTVYVVVLVLPTVHNFYMVGK